MFVYTSIGSFVKSSLCLHAVRPGPRRRLTREAILVSNLREAIRAAKLEVLRVCIARQPLLAQRASRPVRVRRGGVHAEHRTLVIRRQVHLRVRGVWVSDFGFWVLGFGFWVLGFEF